MDLIINKEFGVLRLSFNRAAKRNALNIELAQALTQALEDADNDDAVRVIVLESEQDVFCAGADMEEMKKTPDELDDALQSLFETLARTRKPIIAAVLGPTVGEGVAILLYADIVLAAKEAVFAFPSTALAKIPRFGLVQWGARCANPRLFTQKILLSEPMTAQEALEMGLVTAVTERDAMADALARHASRLAVLPPKAVQATRSLLRREFISAVNRSAAEDNLLYAEISDSSEAREALAAFLEGRAPVFVSAPN